MLNLKQIDTAFKSIFDESKAQMMDSVYELSKDKKFYKLVFSIHSLDVEKDDTFVTTILHTKFIFRVDLDKKVLIDNSFWYLKEINCIYSKVDFEDYTDFLENLQEVVVEENFGKDLKSLSDFMAEAPSSSINDFFTTMGSVLFTVTNVSYNPPFKMSPCEETTFDFDIDINSGEYEIRLSLKKNDSNTFTFYYHLSDVVEEIDSDSIEQLAQLIGNHLIVIYDKHLT
jgi:hypothetical protein